MIEWLSDDEKEKMQFNNLLKQSKLIDCFYGTDIDYLMILLQNNITEKIERDDMLKDMYLQEKLKDEKEEREWEERYRRAH